jgi:hypothetical protein
VTYQAPNFFKVGDVVSISGASPASYNTTSAVVVACTSAFIKVESTVTDAYVSGGTIQSTSGNYSFWRTVGNCTMTHTNTVQPYTGETRAIDPNGTAQVVVSSPNAKIAIGEDAPITRGIPVQPSTLYALSFYQQGTTSSNITPSIVWYDIFGNQLSVAAGTAAAGTAAWSRDILSATSPANAAYAAFELVFSAVGTFYLDMFQFSQAWAVTAATGASGTVTYTAANTGFTLGKVVSISGLGTASGTSLNLSNQLVASVSPTQFTVTNSAIGVSSGTGIVTAAYHEPTGVNIKIAPNKQNILTDPSFEQAPVTPQWTNNATNPSFETASGTVQTVNMVQNPSFEALPAAAVRTNLCTNPNFAAGTTGWSSGANWTIAQITGTKLFGTAALQCTRANTTVGNGFAKFNFNVTSGSVYTLSAYVYGGTGQYGIKVSDSSGTLTTTYFQAPGNCWMRVSTTFTATVTGGATFYLMDDSNAAPTSGTTIVLANVLLEQTPAVGTYFDGGYSVATATLAWSGSANASISTATAIAPTLLRTNLCPNPAAVSASSVQDWTTRWFNNGAGNYSWMTGSGLVGGPDTYVRKQWTTASTGVPGNTGFTVNNASGRAIPVTPGQVLSGSGWVRYQSATSKTNWSYKVYWADSNHNALASPAYNAGAQLTTIPQNTWTQLVVTNLTVPAGAAYASIVLDIDGGSGWGVGDWVDGTGALLELAAVNLPYFDGNSVLPDMTCLWSGQTGLSPATMTGTPLLWTAGAGGLCAPVASTSWHGTGATSARIVALGASRDTFATLPVSTPLSNNTTYTVVGTRYLSAPQSAGALAASYAGGFRVQWNGADLPLTYLNPGTNTAGGQQITATFTTPATGSLGFVRVYSNALQGEPDVFWDNVMVVQGTYTDPYFDGSNPSVYRTNLATDPAATANQSINGAATFASRWYGGSGFAGTTLPVTGASDGPVSGLGTYLRKTWTAVPGTIGNDVSFNLVGPTGKNGFPVSPGQVLTLSFWWRPSWDVSGSGLQNHLIGTFYDATGAALGGQASSTDFAAPAAGSWQRVYYTFTAPTGAAYLGNVAHILYPGKAQPMGATMDITGMLFEQGASLLPYFDGNTARAHQLSYSWVGGANNSQSVIKDYDYTFLWSGATNASTSIRQAPGVSGLATVSFNSNSLQSSAWGKSGAHSLRITPTGTSVDSAATGIGGDTGGMRLGMVAGQTYTALATFYQNTPQTGGLGPFARSIVPIFNLPGVGYTTQSTAQAANTGVNAQQLSLTFTVPANATEAFIRLYNGASAGNGDVWWDNFALIPGSYPGGYFDGATPAAGIYAYQWTGSPNASSSTATTPTPAGWSYSNVVPTQSAITGGNPGPLVTGSGNYLLELVPNNASTVTLSGSGEVSSDIVEGQFYCFSVYGMSLGAASDVTLSLSASAAGAPTLTNTQSYSQVGTITSAQSTGAQVTYTTNYPVAVGQTVSITGVTPASFNLTNAIVTSTTPFGFTVQSPVMDTYGSGGTVAYPAATRLGSAWQRFSVNLYVPAGYSVNPVTLTPVVSYSGGATTVWDAAQLEPRFSPSDYFDGGYLDSAWGAGPASANNSDSFQYSNFTEKIPRLAEEVVEFLPSGTPYTIVRADGVATTIAGTPVRGFAP